MIDPFLEYLSQKKHAEWFDSLTKEEQEAYTEEQKNIKLTPVTPETFSEKVKEAFRATSFKL